MIKDFDRSMWRLLADNLAHRANKVAAVDAGRSATYAELAAQAGRVCDWLRDRGIVPGDRVIVHLRKGIDEVAAMLGAWKAGAVVSMSTATGPRSNWLMWRATAGQGP